MYGVTFLAAKPYDSQSADQNGGREDARYGHRVYQVRELYPNRNYHKTCAQQYNVVLPPISQQDHIEPPFGIARPRDATDSSHVSWAPLLEIGKDSA